MYPNLTEIINGMSYASKELQETPQDIKWPENVDQLEEQAGRLSPAERATFVAGEPEDQLALVEKYDLQLLDEFICVLFDSPPAGSY